MTQAVVIGSGVVGWGMLVLWWAGTVTPSFTPGERVRVTLPGGWGGHMEGRVDTIRDTGAVDVDLGYGLGVFRFDPWDVEPCTPAPAQLRGDGYPVPPAPAPNPDPWNRGS